MSNYYDRDYEDDDDFEGAYDLDDDLEEEDEEEYEEELLPESGHRTDPGVDVSMEVDEDGNEIWYASDSRIPGSTSRGHSVEEAIDGVEDRRREFREMIRKSREERRRRDEG